MPDAVAIHSIRKTFGPKVAVDNVSLRVAQGALCGLIGPNGAGKTTTIRMIMSIIFPDSGTLEVLGRKSAMESKDRIGYLPEERGLYRKMRVAPFLTYMARLKGVDSAAATQRAAAWLERVGLKDAARKKCEELSKGMQQKVQFVASVIHEPDLIILDEVFSGLDPVNRRMMRDLIHEQHGAGRTIIFSTHAMFEAEALCDQVLMIHQGRKVLDGPLHEIIARFDPRTILVEPLNAGAQGTLAAVPGVAEAAALDGRGAAGGSGGVFELRLETRAEQAAVMREVTARVPVRRIELKRVTLEDVFLDVVREAGGEGVDPAALRGVSAERALAMGTGGES
ncbi:ATP-binding cassette domain-containing protein [soil metagenome]